MQLDHRAACLAAPSEARQVDRVGWWGKWPATESGMQFAARLLAYGYHAHSPTR